MKLKISIMLNVLLVVLLFSLVLIGATYIKSLETHLAIANQGWSFALNSWGLEQQLNKQLLQDYEFLLDVCKP